MEDCQHHHACLDGAKTLKEMDAVSHGEGGQNIDDESHRVEDMQMGLEHLVLEFSTKLRC